MKIFLNLKTYKQSTGENGLKLAKICSDFDDVVVIPQVSDIYRISREVKNKVFSQHVDNINYGSNTGFILPESIKEAGASGSLINHSEHRMKLADIEACIEKLRKLNLISVVCTNNINTTAAAASLNPDFVAIEPPELIGSGKAVSKENPDVITGSVKAVKKINSNVKILCGAGISNGEDVRAAMKLGADGVLLASAFVCAENPKDVLENLLSGL